MLFNKTPLICLFLLSITGLAQAAYQCPLPIGDTVRYVSPSGSGSTCSSGSPCSFQTALNASTNGQHIVAKNGTYQVTVFTVNPGVDICAENRLGAILRPPAGWVISNANGGYIELRDTNVRLAGFDMDGNFSSFNVVEYPSVSGASGSTLEYNWIRRSTAALFDQVSSGSIIRHNLIEDSGTEGIYIGSSSASPGGGTLRQNIQIYNNRFYRIGKDSRANAIDMKGSTKGIIVTNNIFENAQNGSDGILPSYGVQNVFRNNVIRNTAANTAVWDYINAWSGIVIDQNVIQSVTSSAEFLWFVTGNLNSGSGYGAATITGNTVCSASSSMCQRNSSNCTLPSGMTQSGNLFNQAQSVCNQRVGEIMGKPTMASARIGEVGDKIVLVDLQADTNPPVSSVGTLQVTYDHVPQTENSVVLVAPQQARITMAQAPASSSVVVRVVAAAGDIANSAFIGGTINGTNDAQTVIATNSVGGPPPVDNETLSQAVWRFAAIHRNEGQGWLAPENVPISSYPGDRFRWRVGVRGGGANAPPRAYALFARLCTPTCTRWARVTDDSSQVGIAYHDDQLTDFGAATTNQLTLGGKNFRAGAFIDDAASIPAVAIGVNDQVEWEYGLKIDRDVVSEGANIQLRVEHDDRHLLDTYNLPTIAVCRGSSNVTGDVGGSK